MSTAQLHYSTVRELIEQAEPHTGRIIFLPAFHQIRLRRRGDRMESRATDRYTAGWFLSELIPGDQWPEGLDLALTRKQWRLVLSVLRPPKGLLRHGILEFYLDGDSVTITAPQIDDPLGNHPEHRLRPRSVTLPIPTEQFPNIDHLRTFTPSPNLQRIVRFQSHYLRRFPAGTATFVAGVATGETDTEPIHVVSDLWHVVVMPNRLIGHDGAPDLSLPNRWTNPEEEP